jgi:hypothetical protein
MKRKTGRGGGYEKIRGGFDDGFTTGEQDLPKLDSEDDEEEE